MKRLIPFLFIAVLISACGGGSSSGAATKNSTHVGTYDGSQTVTVTGLAGSQSITQAVKIFIRTDGTVLIGNAGNIFATGPLNGNSFTMTGPAAVALAEPSCAGTVTFSGNANNGMVTASWSSSGLNCFGLSGSVTGSLTATRTSTSANVSSVLLTVNQKLVDVVQRAFRTR